MKNNEKFLNDLENIPDRFIEEINDSESIAAEVKKSKIHWIRPVSLAACVAVIIAVPAVILNISHDNDNIPVTTEKAETTAETSFSEALSETSSVINVSTEAYNTSVTEVTGSSDTVTVTDVSETVTVTEAASDSAVSQAENSQNEPQSAPGEAEPSANEGGKHIIVIDDPEKEIVKAIVPCDFTPWYIGISDHETLYYEYEADYLVENAQKLSERYYGAVTDEESLINIARRVFSENLGDDIVEYIERDYKIDSETGEKQYVERVGEPYSIKYYEEYDVWKIEPELFSFKVEGQEKVQAILWELAPYLLVRGSDGKILAFWH